MPITNISELRDNLSLFLRSRWSSRNPISTSILLTRINRAQNEYLQLRYNAIGMNDLDESNTETPPNAVENFSAYSARATDDVINLLTQSQFDYTPPSINIVYPPENEKLLTEITYWFTQEELNSKPVSSEQNITKWMLWHNMVKNSNNVPFSHFLRKLRQCSVVKKSPEFKQHIGTFLDKIIISPSVAAPLFAVAADGTTSCNDRVLFTYNLMQQVIIIDDIDKGKYDTILEDFILLARQFYRINQLNSIAKSHMKKNPNVDEIEVYLGFQTKLRQTLDLQNFAPDMHSFRCSKISNSDLTLAESTVKQNENMQFSTWLSHWEPLHKLIERLAPEKIRIAQQNRYIMLENEYPKYVDEMLEKNMLKNIPDAETNMGKIILDRIQFEVDRALITNFFSEQQIIDLINKKIWLMD